MTTLEQSTHLNAILDYLHAKARQRSEVIGIPPLTLYLHLSSFIAEDSVTLPDAPISEDITVLLPQVNEYFLHRRRTPRIQFVDRQCPQMEMQLTYANYTLDEKLPLLVCTPQQFQSPQSPTQLTLIEVTADSTDALLAEGWRLNNEGFNERKDNATENDIALFRQMLGRGRAFSAYAEGVGVGAGMLYAPIDGVSEIVGITTLPPYRRRGIASTLTAAITSSAFAQGAALTFLVAASPEASRVYLRVGYEFVGHLVTMIHQPVRDVPF